MSSQGNTYIFTSESVSEGHPDKVADLVSDSILDAHLAQDPQARVACETLVKDGRVVIAGETTSRGEIDAESIVREAVAGIGYTDDDELFCASKLEVLNFVGEQSKDIWQGVNPETSLDHEQGAGDQGLMFGYATDETSELMPLPILLAHKLTKQLAEDRKAGRVDWLRPDSKSQVSVRYVDGRPESVVTLLVSTQHRPSVEREAIIEYVQKDLAPRALGKWHHDGIEVLANPTGIFVEGGPQADAGLTGRKIIVDTYGGMARHGGGAFSGKDPSKVDRSGAYFCRHVARRIVKEGLARMAEVQVAYAIGRAQPVSVFVETFGTGDGPKAEKFVRDTFDFRPAAMIERLGLLSPIYRTTTNYGHFGRPELPWEKD